MIKYWEAYKNGDPRSRKIFSVGLFLTGMSSLVIISASQVVGSVIVGEAPPWALLTVVLPLIFVSFAMPLANRALRDGGRLFSGSWRIKDVDLARPYILYLRPFEGDVHVSGHQRQSWLLEFLRSIFKVEKSEEEHLVDALSGLPSGRVLAVAQPTDRSHYTGAIRVQLTSDNWQPEVSELMSGSSRTVILAGTSHGTLWELAEAVRILPPDRLIVVVAMSRATYMQFAKTATEFVHQHLRAHGERDARRISESWALPSYEEAADVSTAIRGVIVWVDGVGWMFRPLKPYILKYGSLRGMLLRVIPSASGRLRSYMRRPPSPIYFAGILQFLQAALYILDIVLNESATDVVRNLAFHEVWIVTYVLVGVLLVRGTPRSRDAGLAISVVVLIQTFILERNALMDAVATHDSLHLTCNVIAPALALLLLNLSASEKYYDQWRIRTSSQ